MRTRGHTPPDNLPVSEPVPLTENELQLLANLGERLRARQFWERTQIEAIARSIIEGGTGSLSDLEDLTNSLIEFAEAICEGLTPYVKRREP